MKTEAQHLGRVFDVIADGYDHPALRFFPFCADYMMHRLQPAPGSKVLDVASGTGAVAIAAAQRIGAGGRVFAIDSSERMLDRAFENVQKMALDNVDLHVMDAQQLEFRGRYFDYVVCSFGLFLVSDRAAAVREWLRVLKPGGRLMISTFAAGAFEPLAELFAARMANFGVEVLGGDRSPAWRQTTDSEACAEMLRCCGAIDVEVHSKQLGYHLAGTDDWWAVLWNSGFRAYLQQLGPEQLEAMKNEHLAEVAALSTEDGIWLNVPVHILQARRPI